MTLTIRKILIAASVFLCVGFLVQFGLSLYEYATWPAPEQGTISFAVDAPPEYSVGLFHGLSFFLLLTVVFAKRYFAALSLGVVYFVLYAFPTSSRLCTGFFGGDLCPDGPISLWAINRASWFDWLATFLLLLIIGLTATVVRRSARSRLD